MIRLRILAQCDHPGCQAETRATARLYVEPVELRVGHEDIRFQADAHGNPSAWTQSWSDGIRCPEHAKGESGGTDG